MSLVSFGSISGGGTRDIAACTGAVHGRRQQFCCDGRDLLIRKRSAVARWVARLAGTILIVLNYKHALYEVNRLVVQKWAYGERIFSVAFLAMLLGMVVGWWNHRFATALILSGYILATIVPFVSHCPRPMLGADAQAVAVYLIPFLAVGLVYAYSGKRYSGII
jgi:hypothetical protein